MTPDFSDIVPKVHFVWVVGSIPTAPTKTIHSQRLIEAFDTNKAFDTI